MHYEFTLTKRDGCWYYYTYDENGKRHRYALGLKGKAKMAAAARCMDLAKAGKLIPNRNLHVTFSDFSRQFWIYETCPIVQDRLARGGHYSISLCKSNRQSMDKHITPAFGRYRLDAITPAMVNKWLLQLPKPRKVNGVEIPGISRATANKMLAILQVVLDEAVRQRIIQVNPAKSVKRLAPEATRRQAFTLAEARDLLKNPLPWANQRAYAASLLAAATGMRLGEIRALRTDYVRPDSILIAHSLEHMTGGLKGTKSGQVRETPITAEVREAVLTYAPDSGYVFSLDNGKTPVSQEFLTRYLQLRMDALKITGKTFHSWRHFFNTRLVASGVSGDVVRAIVGHQSEEMTARYLHLHADDMDAVRKIQQEIAG